MLKTPVLLIGFNRPDTTQRVFSAVREAKPTRLYFAVDGPRPGYASDLENCAIVRALADQVDWPCELRTLFRTENVGCRAGVVGAIDWMFESESAGIILEDDCVPVSGFFDFCDTLLPQFAENELVAQISGSSFAPMVPEESYFYTKYADIWGWATWRRAWRQLDLGMTDWPQWRDAGGLAALPGASAGFVAYWTRIFNAVHAGKVPSVWDYQWMYTCWKLNWVSIQPSVPLIRNIGFGHDATHHAHVFVPSYVRDPKDLAFPLTPPPNSRVDPVREREIAKFRYFIGPLSEARAHLEKIPGIGVLMVKIAKFMRARFIQRAQSGHRA